MRSENSGIESRETIETLKEITAKSLLQTFAVHEKLGESGFEVIKGPNAADTGTLRADMEMEEAILDYLKKEKIPIRVISEEHGTVDITSNPEFLGILDGLDGTSVYKKERGTGRYGTMFGIFRSTDPTYDDYVTGGVMEHGSKRLFTASKDDGAFVTDIQTQIKTQIHTLKQTQLDNKIKIYNHEWFKINREVFVDKLKDYNSEYLWAAEAYQMSVASGEAGAALFCTFKGNLEMAVAYGILNEAGGVMIDINGEQLGNKKYLEYGQQDQIPIISAANLELARALLKILK